MTKWTGHDGSSDCPKVLRGTGYKVELIIYEKRGTKAGNVSTYNLSFDNAGHIGCWRKVAAWRVIEPSLDERILAYLNNATHIRPEKLIKELKERIENET